VRAPHPDNTVGSRRPRVGIPAPHPALLRLLLQVLSLVLLAACGARSELLVAVDQTTGGTGGAGGTSGTGGTPATGCQTNADCPTGQLCDPAHVCIPVPGGCSSDADCAAPTPHCRLDTHTCVVCTETDQCPPGDQCTGYQCVGPCGVDVSCPSSFTCCSPLCVDLASDPGDCGTCGNACGPYHHAVPACSDGACGIGACIPGFTDCDGEAANGCEVDTGNDPQNCGTCGHVCPEGLCSAGTCSFSCAQGGCTGGLSCCGTSCVDQQADKQNCGACGVACGELLNGIAGCVAGACEIVACSAGFADCDGMPADGCEADTNTDVASCGTCGNACAPGETCVVGTCQLADCQTAGCPAGTACCGDQCIDTDIDLFNCGGCGMFCPVGSNACQHGACCTLGPDGVEQCGTVLCPPPSSLCDNQCVDESSNPDHCGGCGIKCESTACVGGVCDCHIDGQTCGGGLSCCPAGCVDTGSDPNNCGQCLHACAEQQGCYSGVCM
jgi:hypothetical protein